MSGDVVDFVVFFAGGLGVGMAAGLVALISMAARFWLQDRRAARGPLCPLVPLQPIRDQDQRSSVENAGC